MKPVLQHHPEQKRGEIAEEAKVATELMKRLVGPLLGIEDDRIHGQAVWENAATLKEILPMLVRAFTIKDRSRVRGKISMY